MTHDYRKGDCVTTSLVELLTVIGTAYIVTTSLNDL